MDKIEAISLLQFLTIHCFRHCNDYVDLDNVLREDTNIIRIYYEDNGSFKDMKWFEFGMYDWSTNTLKINTLKDILSEKILNMYVYAFNYNEDTEVLHIYLKEGKELYD